MWKLGLLAGRGWEQWKKGISDGGWCERGMGVRGLAICVDLRFLGFETRISW